MAKSTNIPINERQNIAEMIRKHGITRKEVAIEAGVSIDTVFRYFRGKSNSVKVQNASIKLLGSRVKKLSESYTNELTAFIDLTSNENSLA